MYLEYQLPDGTRFWLGAAIESHVHSFCAFDYLASFRNYNGGSYLAKTPNPKKVKNREAAAVDFVKNEIKRFARGSKLLIADRVNNGFHSAITRYLPEEFTATNSARKKLICKVEHCKPYKNLNTGQVVQEVYIHMEPYKAPSRKTPRRAVDWAE